MACAPPTRRPIIVVVLRPCLPIAPLPHVISARSPARPHWQLGGRTLHHFPAPAKVTAMTAYSASLTTWALQRVGSYLRYSRRDASVFATAAHDPQETLGSGRQASGSSLSARRRYGNLRQSQRGPKPLGCQYPGFKLERFAMTRFLATLLASAALSISLPLHARAELDVISLKSAIERSVESDYPKLDALYKDIHAHPEIAFQEEKTAAKLAAEMRALGFEVTEHVGKTGLVAIYKNSDGPTIMVRTELDALPMEEKTGLAYASHDKTIWQGRETFVAHSCGHDIHMASWVGTAKTLVGLKDQWHGTLMFIAQPAEEIGSGAKAMLADGLFTRFPKPDFGFALHDGAFAYGNISYRVGIGSSHFHNPLFKIHCRRR